MRTIYTPRHRGHAPNGVLVDGERFSSKEVPERAEAIRAAIEATGLGPVVPPKDQGLAPVLAVHTADYVDYLQNAHARYAAHRGEPHPLLAGRSSVDPRRADRRPDDFPELRDYYTYDYEDPILLGTWDAAYWAVQVAVTAAQLLLEGEQASYALCRPPGHHATRDQYGGFCYLNNAAAAARDLARTAPVAILDLDYHHGNGTQDIFYDDETVLYVSLHADPAADYPFCWGYADERGTGSGLGTNVNFPLPLGCEDSLYLATLDRALDAVAKYAPAYLVISLGVDAVVGDPIGKFGLTLAGWADAGYRVAALDLPTVVVQEGGYRLDAMGSSVVAFLSSFAVL